VESLENRRARLVFLQACTLLSLGGVKLKKLHNTAVTCHDYYPKHSVFESWVQTHFTPCMPANRFYTPDVVLD